MPDELIDIVDENNQPIGQAMKSEAHAKGLWHRAIHVWIYNSKGEILFQLRADDKEFFPGHWDLSVGGHVGAGEEPLTSALRELKEELGVSAQPDDLEFLFIHTGTLSYKEIDNREHLYVYLLHADLDPTTLKLQREEVAEARFFAPHDAYRGAPFLPNAYWDELKQEIARRTNPVQSYLREQKIVYTLHMHPPVFTVEEADVHCKDIPGLSCKNLFLKDKRSDSFFLVSVPANKRVDLKDLGQQLHADFTFGKEEDMRQLLGVTPGAVSPFNLLNDTEHEVTFIIDREVWTADIVSFHPNDNTMTIELSQEMFCSFVQSLGHEPRILDVRARHE